MWKTWLVVFSATVAAAAVGLLGQHGLGELQPNKQRDYQHVYLYDRETNEFFMYSLKGRGLITGTYVRSMDAVQVERNGAHCFQIDALPQDDGIAPTLTWTDSSGRTETASKPAGIRAFVCDGHMLGGVI